MLTCLDLFGDVITSPESEAGNTLSSSPAGLMSGTSGPAHAPVSHSRQPGSDGAKLTSGTCGPISSDSLRPECLQSFLVNRLRQRMGGSGSPEYALTWKNWDMTSGRLICALRASGRRISGSDCSGWPSPTSLSFAESHQPGNNRYMNKVCELAGWPSPNATIQNDGNGFGLTLGQAATLTGWPTPDTMHSKSGHGCRGGKVGNGSQSGASLSAIAELAGWATPTCRDGRDGRDGRASDATMAKNSRPLNEQAVMLGPTQSPLTAGTENRGVLDAAFSRWLMGFPATWDDASPNFAKWQKTQDVIASADCVATEMP